MKTKKTKTEARPRQREKTASKRMTVGGNRKTVIKDLSHTPLKAKNVIVAGKRLSKARDIGDPNPNDHVQPTFHVVGTCGGVGGLINASLTPVGGGSSFNGTPADQDGSATSYDFLFSNIPTGTYSVQVTNGDGVTPI